MIKIITVKNSKQVKDFVMFPFKLYKDCEYWVPPIIKEEIEAMDTSKNPVFKNAEAEFYLAYDEQQNIVGRIAAIVNWVEIKDQKKNKLRCMWHNWEFSTETGKCLTFPIKGKLNPYDFEVNPKPLKSYKVFNQENKIYAIKK